MELPLLESALGELTNTAGETAANATGLVADLAGNWFVIGGGIILIIAAILIFMFLKKIIVNSVLGIVAWAILVFVFKIEMGLITTLVISAIFGLAGVGVILVLKFLGIPI